MCLCLEKKLTATRYFNQMNDANASCRSHQKSDVKINFDQSLLCSQWQHPTFIDDSPLSEANHIYSKVDCTR